MVAKVAALVQVSCEGGCWRMGAEEEESSVQIWPDPEGRAKGSSALGCLLGVGVPPVSDAQSLQMLSPLPPTPSQPSWLTKAFNDIITNWFPFH